jgi:hypothetical protein
MAAKPTLVQLILNATTAGKSMLTAANAAAQKVLLSLGNVDNTSDANKPVSTAQQTAFDAKVTGPSSATDNAIVRFDATTGKLVQNSSATVDDSGFVAGTRLYASSAIPIIGTIVSGGTNSSLQNGVGGCRSGLVMVSGNMVTWSESSTEAHTGNGVTGIARNAAGVVEINSGTAGTFRDLKLRDLTASGVVCAGTYTVGTLPSAAANAYKFATVSDSSVTTFGSTVAAGGSSNVMVFSNGTNWTVFAI